MKFFCYLNGIREIKIQIIEIYFLYNNSYLKVKKIDKLVREKNYKKSKII